MNNDEIGTSTEHFEDQDQLYEMLTKSKEIEQSQQRPGNINFLLFKSHGKT